MSTTIDWPDELRPAQVEWGLIVPQLAGRSAFDGSAQAATMGAPRWFFNIESGPLPRPLVPKWEAHIQRLRGKVNRVRAWDWRRETPLGVATGTPAVRVSAAGATLQTKGWTASTLGILRAGSYFNVGGGGVNLLAPYGGFEAYVSTMATGWTYYHTGSAAATPNGYAAGNGSARSQEIDITNITGGVAGVQLSASVPVRGDAPHTFAIDVKASTTQAYVWLYIGWYTAGGVYISDASSTAPATTGWARRTLTATAPVGAGLAFVYTWCSDLTGSPLAFNVYFDNAQFEEGPLANPFSDVPVSATVGELKRLNEDLHSDASGYATASFEPPLRVAPAVNVQLVLVKPKAKFMLMTDRPGMPQKGARHPGWALGFEEDLAP